MAVLVFLFVLAYSQCQNYSVSNPPINAAKNVICNTDSAIGWGNVVSQLKILEDSNVGNFSIVQLGDSHMQGGYFAERLRELLNQKYGVSGYGWAFPHSYAKANGSENVKFSSITKWEGRKFNHLLSGESAQISGYHLVTSDSIVQLTLKLKSKTDSLYPFNELVIYHNKVHLIFADSCNAMAVEEKCFGNFFATRLIFSEMHDSVNLRFSAVDSIRTNFTLLGINLLSSQYGVVYHSIGVNGASFKAFNRMIDYSHIIRQLLPNLVIVSLGTNDSNCEKLDRFRFRKQVETLIDSIQAILPGVCILLTTAGDNLRAKQFANANLRVVRDEIIRIAVRKHCAYWDFYAVMGEMGSAKLWKERNIMYLDMIHLRKIGYVLQGELFSDAFTKAMNKTNSNGQD